MTNVGIVYFVNELLLYDVTAKKMFKEDLPADLRIAKSDYMLSWGYKPTLVSPGSIVRELNQYRSSACLTEVLSPLILQDRRKGQETTLEAAS